MGAMWFRGDELGDGDLIDRFIHHLLLEGKSPHTRRLYRGRLNDLVRHMDGRPLLDADRADLLEWRKSLHLAPISIGPYVVALRRFYAWALDGGLITANPAVGIPTPHPGRRLPRPIGDDDLEHAITRAVGRVRAWLVLAGYAGLRCVEIARLRRESIYPTAREPYMIVHGKRDKERAVNMSPYVWTELRLYGLPRRGWVFPRLDGLVGHVPAGSVSAEGNRHLHECGIDETMHQLRHRFGTVGYQETGDLRELQELLGHDSLDTTALYAGHSNPRAAALVRAVQPRTTTLRVVES